MADINKLKDKIKSTIYPNGKGAINASDHQAMLLDMADGMAETDTKLTELSQEIKVAQARAQVLDFTIDEINNAIEENGGVIDRVINQTPIINALKNNTLIVIPIGAYSDGSCVVQGELDDAGALSIEFDYSGFHYSAYIESKFIEADKEEIGSNIVIDEELSSTSTNPVQNKVIESKFSSVLAENERLKERIDEQDIFIEDLQDMKIDRENDDYYPKMAVGLADNLAGEDVVDSEVNFRRSGGGAISDGVARIESIKGNSVVWNQLANGAATLSLLSSHKYMTIIGSVAAIKTNIATLDVAEGDRVYNLTKMFGSGNEPTTIEEFYAKISMGVDLNAYNEGEVISMDVQSVESQGVNAWDEEWEMGYIDASNGNTIYALNYICAKNKIHILPNTTYHFAKPAGVYTIIAYYDMDGLYIGQQDPFATSSIGGTFKTFENAHYMRFHCAISEYNHDICINISDASINGKYFPHIKRVEDLAVIRKYFPNGMRSVGTAHDEIRYNKVTQKWEMVEAIGIRAYQEGDADNAAYLTDGKVTCYPLAEPIVTELDAEDQFKDLDYQVWNCGTEKAIAEGKSAPLAAGITYGFNAPAKIKENADKIKENANEIAKLKQSSGSTTTYKTINGTSVVGSGNIDTHYPISSSTASALTIQPNTYYKWSGATLNVTLGSTDANLCEFVIELAVTGTPSITFPSSVKWANGIAPTFVSGKSYIVSIVNNLGVYAAF